MAEQPKSRVTLKMIAQASKLSVSAVSQILNNKAVDFCSSANKERVRQIAREMGYHSLAERSAQKELHSVAVFTAADRNETTLGPLGHVALLLGEEYERRGYACFFCAIDPDRQRIESFLACGTERFIFLRSPSRKEELHGLISAAGRTAVFLDSLPSSGTASTAFADIAGAIDELLSMLLKNGTHLAICQSNHATTAERLQLLSRMFPGKDPATLRREFIHELPSLSQNTDFSLEAYRAGEQFMRQFLQRKPKLDAIFFESDAFAAGAIPVLLEQFQATGNLPALGTVNTTGAMHACVYPILTIELNCTEAAKALMADFTSEQPNQPIKLEIRRSSGWRFLNHP